MYSAVMLFFAALYAFLCGIAAKMETGAIFLDAAVYGLLLIILGILLWNVLNYALPEEGMMKVRTFLILATGITAVVILLGAETLAMWIREEGQMREFAATLPQRALITALAYALLVLFYLNDHGRSESKTEEVVPLVRQQANAIERITIRAGKKVKIISLDEIEYLQAEGDYVAIITPEGRWLKEKTMKYFEEHLPAGMFARIHRSYIVNLSKIIRLERYGNQYQIIVREGTAIKVSANGYKVLKQQMNL